MKKNFKIYYTSDTHGYLMPIDYGTGKEKQAGLLNCISQFKKDGNTLIIDGGDTIQGSPYLYYYAKEWQKLKAVHLVAQVMNTGEYDYITLGNHDFNFGKSYLNHYLSGLRAKCLCANIQDIKQEIPIISSRIHTLANGLRIGLIGITTDYIKVWEAKENIKDFEISDPFMVLKEELEKIKEVVDVTICIYHGGFEADLNTGKILTTSDENIGYKICEKLDIDLLLTAHQHSLIHGRSIQGTYVLQLMANGEGYGVIEGEVVGKQKTFYSQIIKAGSEYSRPAYKLLLPFEKKVESQLVNMLGVLNKETDDVGCLERALKGNNMAALVNKVQLHISGAQLSCTSLPNEIVNLEKYISMREILVNYPFSNTLVVVEITGECLKRALERIFSYFDISKDDQVVIASSFLTPKEEHYNYDYIAGIVCEVNLRKSIGQRVEKLMYQGEIIKDSDCFTLCLNSYRASGAGGYEMYLECPVKKQLAVEVNDLVIRYIEEKQYIDLEEDFNYHFKY